MSQIVTLQIVYIVSVSNYDMLYMKMRLQSDLSTIPINIISCAQKACCHEDTMIKVLL